MEIYREGGRESGETEREEMLQLQIKVDLLLRSLQSVCSHWQQMTVRWKHGNSILISNHVTIKKTPPGEDQPYQHLAFNIHIQL